MTQAIDTKQLSDLLTYLVDSRGSDLHLVAGSPPRIRVDGVLKPLDRAMLSPEDTSSLIHSILNEEQKKQLETQMELDMSFGIGNLGRFRANFHWQRGSLAGSFRLIPYEIKKIDEIGLPQETYQKILSHSQGLVLVTGATGSGKSTTLAAMIDHINHHHEGGHIVTIEDPIEFVHHHDQCLVTQREVNSDTESFHKALKSSLRQDPDIILIGEIRDRETLETALTLSETGHLTFGTLHTSDCVQTINRIIDMFPAEHQLQVRTQLSFTLKAVFCQRLLPLKSGEGRVLCAEIMIMTPAIQSLIRDNQVHQIYSHIQTGKLHKMKTINVALAELYHAGKITQETALKNATDLEELNRLLHQRRY